MRPSGNARARRVALGGQEAPDLCRTADRIPRICSSHQVFGLECPASQGNGVHQRGFDGLVPASPSRRASARAGPARVPRRFLRGRPRRAPPRRPRPPGSHRVHLLRRARPAVEAGRVGAGVWVPLVILVVIPEELADVRGSPSLGVAGAPAPPPPNWPHPAPDPPGTLRPRPAPVPALPPRPCPGPGRRPRCRGPGRRQGLQRQVSKLRRKLGRHLRGQLSAPFRSSRSGACCWTCRSCCWSRDDPGACAAGTTNRSTRGSLEDATRA